MYATPDNIEEWNISVPHLYFVLIAGFVGMKHETPMTNMLTYKHVSVISSDNRN